MPFEPTPPSATLGLIFENAPVGIIQLDEERRYVYANPAYVKFIGYSLEELRRMKMFDVTHPDDLVETRRLSELIAKEDYVIRRYEKRYVRKDGHVVYGLVTSQRMKNPADGRAHLVTVIEDITEIRKQQEELRRAEAEIKHFFFLTHDLMLVVGLDGQIKRANEAFSNQFGFRPAELEGRSIFDFIHPEDLEKTHAELARLQNGGDSLQFENRCVTKAGDYRIISWVSVADVGLGLIFTSGRDVTHRRRDEMRLAYSAKMASLGEMAGGIAHEVNNPLAIILGKVTNLQAELRHPEPDPDRMREDLDAIERTGLRIAKIVRGLRAFSRNGEADPKVRVSLARVVDETLELCAERLKSRNIDLRVNCPRELTVRGRPSQLSQVLMNLLGNAYDAVEKQSTPWIHLDAERRGEVVILTVTDSGKGIAPPVAARMMEPFFTTKEVGKGTGLGLSISKGIAEEHGGALRYEKAGENTRFTLELPAAEA
jgi:PAS domain S-box-containing protein